VEDILGVIYSFVDSPGISKLYYVYFGN